MPTVIRNLEIMEIRKADTYDAEMISLIGKIASRKAFGNVFTATNLEEYLKEVYNPDKIAVNLENSDTIYFMAEINDRPVGFAKLKKFSLNDEIESGSQMQLEKIYVLPDYQNKGAGSALLQEVIATVNYLNPDYLWLDVYTGNEQAIRLYERNGFRKGTVYQQGYRSQAFQFYRMILPVNVDETLFCQ